MAPPYKYECQLTQDQRQTLEEIVSRGMHNAREIRRARILLLCDCSELGPHHARKFVAQLLRCTEPTVTKTIQRFGDCPGDCGSGSGIRKCSPSVGGVGHQRGCEAR